MDIHAWLHLLTLELTENKSAVSAFCGNDFAIINNDNRSRHYFIFTQQPSTQEQKHLANNFIFIIDGFD